ncbi:hypothetical protein [Streptomyces sp. NPDC058240]|uniref:hypothetical protein n=1 Tax=Streptomyces sp. NPDC058240 TaxID=3346396 RepID=UPI0036EE80A5
MQAIIGYEQAELVNGFECLAADPEGLRSGCHVRRTVLFLVLAVPPIVLAPYEFVGCIKYLVVEPGGFATDWAGASMQTPDVASEYDATVGEMVRLFSGANAPGDPKRAGDILVRVVKHPAPPSHLVIGAGAVEMAQDYARGQLEEAARWEAVSRSADFDQEPVDLPAPTPETGARS